MAIKATGTIMLMRVNDGADGQSVVSITAEYALSNSKTTAPTTWSATPPIWESGKYIWTRSKIVYRNPTSTAYTTPIVDSSWEAVNEIEVGGRNLALKSNEKVISSAYLVKKYETSINNESNTTYTATIKGEINSGQKFGLWMNVSASNQGYFEYNEEKDIYELTFKSGSMTAGLNEFSIYNWPSSGANSATIEWVKLEKGNKATDWTPAPEDIQAELDDKADSSNVNNQVSDIWESLNGKLSSSEFETMKEMAEALQESYNQYTDPEAGTAYKNLQALEKRIEKIIIDLGNEVASFNFIKTYMKMGEEGFIIGQEGAPMKMILTNNRLSFVDGDKENEVAYFSGQSFYINQGAILKSLQIGTHKTTDLGNGSTVIQWTV